jgi:heterodisulfide reductase subunit A2
LVECGRHLNIEIHTLSEITNVVGSVGNYTITVKHKPRYVDMEKCIACGLCAEKCPKKVDDEFNMGLSKRKAIYIQYGQTVPLKYAIDESSCLFLQKGKCRACEKFCPTGAINFEDMERTQTIKAGAVILSPGYKPFDPSQHDYTGYKRIPDVVTAMEYERMLSAGGPFMGHLVKPSDNQEPLKIAWLQCVGSRSINRHDRSYCSSVCCMYAIKQCLVTADHLPAEASQTVFYMDIRSHGKDFDRYYVDAAAKGVRFIRERPHTIDPGPEGSGVTITWMDAEGGKRMEVFDLAVLSVGMEPSPDAENLSKVTGIGLNDWGFAQTDPFAPSQSTKKGICIGGSFSGPMAIPRAVTQASTAACKVAMELASAKGTLTKEKTYPEERPMADGEPRIGVFVCSCGINIASVVDVGAVAEYAKTLPHVVFVENNLFTCSTDTQVIIGDKVKELNLNRVVIAACTPRTHEPLFQETLKDAGLSGYLMEMANIRNQNSWVHKNTPELATQKAKDQVRIAVAKVALAQPLQSQVVPVTQKALVIGGGLAGMTAALGFAEMGYDTVLVEKSEKLGGNAHLIQKTANGLNVKPALEQMIAEVERKDRITVMKNAALVDTTGSVGNFKGMVQTNDGNSSTVDFGVAVVATGGRETSPTEYLYGDDPAVFTHLEFDAFINIKTEAVRRAECVAFIQCVGSRCEERPYCSRVCCAHTVKKAIELKEMDPDKQVYVLYRDIRTYGLNEIGYHKARQLGVIFMQYDPEHKPEVYRENAKIVILAKDHVLRQPVAIYADYLVLAAAIEPAGTAGLSKLFKFSVDEDGFVNEAHPKLRPVDMSVEGLFVAGLCHYPKPLDEAIAQARAAVSRASVLLAKTEMKLDPIKSFVTEQCDGCALCVDVCPYNAISLVEYQGDSGMLKRIETDTALCKGCGICAATCPKGGVQVHGFTMDQLMAQVEALIKAS